MVNQALVFEGKYRIQAADGFWMEAAPMGCALILTKAENTENGRFNFYRSAPQDTVIQAMNGLYLAEDSSGGYAASQTREDALHVQITEQMMFLSKDARGTFYMNAESGMLKMRLLLAGDVPPSSAVFTVKKVTGGEQELLEKGGAGWDLDRVSLYSADFGGLDFSKCSAQYADLSGIDLRKANLQGAVLNHADFSTGLLSDADFSQCSLIGANLDAASADGSKFCGSVLNLCSCRDFSANESDFNGAVLIQSNCYNASFMDADLRNCDFRNSNLESVTWDGSQLNGSDFSGALIAMTSFCRTKLDSTTVFNGSRMKQSDFQNMNLSGISMAHADLEDSYFDDTDLTGADLSYANLKRASFRKAVLNNSSLVNAYLEETDFTGAQLGYSAEEMAQAKEKHAADLTGAYMPNAVMDRANLNGVNMSGVNWYGNKASAVGAYMHLVNFSNANLGTMDFTQADLYGSTFDYANLIGTNFSKAVLKPAMSQKRVSFAYANIQGADFFESEIMDAIFSDAAAALPVEEYFSLPGELAQYFRKELNKNHQKAVSDRLRAEFNSRNIVLPENAVTQVSVTDCKWNIAGAFDKPKFVLTLEYGELQVRGGIHGVSLFRIEDEDGSIRDGLRQKIMTEALKKRFEQVGYHLNPNACVGSSAESGKSWGIDNDLHDNKKLQRGYLEFYVVSKGKNLLTVYGTILGTVRIGEDDTFEQEWHVMAATGWIPDLLKNDCICPSGQKISVVTDPRPGVRMSWEEAMTANTLPRVPECIPSPWSWC